MVEFYGNCSDEVKKQTEQLGIIKKYGEIFPFYALWRLIIIALIAVGCAAGTAALIVYVAQAGESTERAAAIFGICILSPLFIAAVILGVRGIIRFPKVRYNDIYWVYDVKIDELRVDWSIYDSSDELVDDRRAIMSNIEKVLESELCYYIILKKRTMLFERFIICQKDLIIEGSIEKFKNYFGKKIKPIKLKEKKTKPAPVAATATEQGAEDVLEKP